MILSGLLGAAIGLATRYTKFHWPRELTWLGSLGAIATLFLQDPAILRIFFNNLGEMLSWIEVVRDQPVFPWSDVWNYPVWVHQMMHPLFWLMVASFFILTEVDRITGESTQAEAQRLGEEYQGSVQYAECARPADGTKIHQEIDHKVRDVDHAIEVLLTAGMSTPALRYIANAGVDITYAAYAEITAAAILLGPMEVVTISHFAFHLIYGLGVWYIPVLQGISVMGRIILVVILCGSKPDHRRFILKVLSKFAALLFLLLVVVCLVSVFIGNILALVLWLVISDIGLLFLIPIASLGIEGTANLPGCGIFLSQFLFARGTRAFAAWNQRHLCCNQRGLALSSSSSDSDWGNCDQVQLMRKSAALGTRIWFGNKAAEYLDGPSLTILIWYQDTCILRFKIYLRFVARFMPCLSK